MPRVGEVRKQRIRRIGKNHFVILPTQHAALVDAAKLRAAIQQYAKEAEQAQAVVNDRAARISDIERQLAAFELLPIARTEDDPDVPQE